MDKGVAVRYISLLKSGKLKETPQLGPFWCQEEHYYAKGRFVVERFAEGEEEKPLEFTEEAFRDYLLTFTGSKEEQIHELVGEIEIGK